jgi:hypothetical protein
MEQDRVGTYALRLYELAGLIQGFSRDVIGPQASGKGNDNTTAFSYGHDSKPEHAGEALRILL